MAADESADRTPRAEGGAGGQPSGRVPGSRRRRGRRRTLTALVLLCLVTGAGLGVRQVRQDPIRYGLTVPPLVDGADYGEAYLVRQLRRNVEHTAGPYVGPKPNLSGAVGAINSNRTIGPTGQPTSSEVLASAVSPGRDFTAKAEALVQLCFYGAGWLLPSEEPGPPRVRCRTVTVRYSPNGGIQFSSRRAACPPGSVAPPPGGTCAR
jgi:hypothetical protein